VGKIGVKKVRKEKKRLRKKEAKWEWRKRYRVWDANRKIFLFPENWIEPDVVLPAEYFTWLREILVAVRTQFSKERPRVHKLKWTRPKGVRVLVTSKNRTAALIIAQTLASDLGKDLYGVDLSSVVSKYIGETEKNVGRAFDAAEAAGPVLLFDGAEAFFGRRTKVKDSHDRYANIEINYLFQRTEDFGGLSILSMDERSQFDKALLRRFRFVIRMPPHSFS
jgi:SpoVK/Ycf46/Vps4 family AAA+-type ATPase